MTQTAHYKWISKLFLMLSCLALLASYGCKTAKGLMADIEGNSARFPYLTPAYMLPTSDSPYAIHCEVNFKSALQDTTVVHKDDFWCVPLLFVNMWEANHTVFGGADLINGRVEDHCKSSLVNALDARRHYPLAPSADARFRIELDVDSIKTTGFYHSEGNYMVLPLGFYVYISWSEQEYMGPVETRLEARFSVYDREHLVYRGQCSTTDYLPTFHFYRHMEDEEVAAAFVNDVAQSLDNCFYSMASYVVSQSSMVLDLYNDVTLRVDALHPHDD